MVRGDNLRVVTLFFCSKFCVFRDGATPGTIPNPEAKAVFAHNTVLFKCGNVGQRKPVVKAIGDRDHKK